MPLIFHKRQTINRLTGVIVKPNRWLSMFLRSDTRSSSWFSGKTVGLPGGCFLTSEPRPLSLA